MNANNIFDGVGPEYDLESDPSDEQARALNLGNWRQMDRHQLRAWARRARRIRERQELAASQPGCFVPGCPNKTTSRGILCISHFMDGFVFKGGEHG